MTDSKVLGIIPARYASTRFPGKPLAMIGSKPMIQWVYEAALKSKEIDFLAVATDDKRIFDAVKHFGGNAVITSSDHATGSDRIIEAAGQFKDYGIIVNIQGDEPGIEPALIDGVIRLKKDQPEFNVTTAARPFQKYEDPTSPDRVKVVFSKNHSALYFSRSLIPYPRQSNTDFYMHLGIYVYDRKYLFGFNNLDKSSLEETESLEQLRILENGGKIGVFITRNAVQGVGTPEDLKVVSDILLK
jgi:3-deoxy-manno-octulosonate cytidylyltransferase (CMP-KDO synthetase)